MSNGALKVDDASFWTDPFAARAEAEAAAFEGGFRHGVLLDMPREVSLDARTTCPLAGFWSRTQEVDQTLSLASQGVAIVLDARTHEARVGMPFPPSARRPAPPDDPRMAKHVDILGCFQADLRAGVDLPWRPGTFRVAVAAREFLSNVVTVTLARRGGYQDPAVAAFLERERREGIPAPAPVFPASALAGAGGSSGGRATSPSYRRHDASPPIPAGVGVALAAERVIVAGAGARSALRGSFRLPALPQERVRPDARGARPDVGDPEATAVVPIHLISSGSENPIPRLVTLRVPSYDPVDLGAEEAWVTGHFEVDLFEAGVVGREAQTYFVNVAAGGQISGPTAIGVVAPASLPFARG